MENQHQSSAMTSSLTKFLHLFEFIVMRIFIHLYMHVILTVQFTSATHVGGANVRALQFMRANVREAIVQGLMSRG